MLYINMLYINMLYINIYMRYFCFCIITDVNKNYETKQNKRTL